MLCTHAPTSIQINLEKICTTLVIKNNKYINTFVILDQERRRKHYFSLSKIEKTLGTSCHIGFIKKQVFQNRDSGDCLISPVPELSLPPLPHIWGYFKGSVKETSARASTGTPYNTSYLIFQIKLKQHEKISLYLFDWLPAARLQSSRFIWERGRSLA